MGMNDGLPKQKKAKILVLLEILYKETNDEKGLTTEEIIEKLGLNGIKAERKSIYNDISVLNEMGYKIEKRKSMGVTRYHFSGRLFSLSELKLLVDSVITSRFITKEQSDMLANKLESLASTDEVAELKREIYIEDRPKTQNDEVFKNLDIINNARKKGLRIDFEYYEWTKEKRLEKRKDRGDRKDVSPCFLEFYNGNYYLIALNESGEVRHFRVDKMRNIKQSSMKIDRNVGGTKFSNPARYSAKTIGMYDGEDTRVFLEVAEEKVGVLFDYFGVHSVTVNPISDGVTVKCSVEIKLSKQFYGWLFGVSDIVKLTGPDEAIEGYKNQLEKAMKEV